MTTLYIDNTILTAFKQCRLEGWLSYAKGYDRHAPRTPGAPQRPMNLKFQFGTAFHLAMAEWLKTHEPLKTMATFRDNYEPYTTPPPDDDRYTWHNARDLVAGWLYAQQAQPATFHPHETWVERHLEVPFHRDDQGDIVFVSRPDALGTLDGYPGTYACETKTTGSWITGDWSRQWEKSSQLTSQLWAIQAVTGTPPAGALVHTLQVSKLPDGPTKCREHGIPRNQCRLSHTKWQTFGPYIRSQQAMDDWYRYAVDLALDYRRYLTLGLDALARVPADGEFAAYTACRLCAWNDWCIAGKDPNLVVANARLAPWNPRVGRREAPAEAHTPSTTEREEQ